MKSSVLTVLFAVGLVLGMALGLVAGEPVSVAGSTTVKPIAEHAVAEFTKTHANAEFAVGGGGSSNGIKLAGEGQVQIGMASRDLKANEKTEYPGLTAIRIGTDGIVLVVNADNPVDTLTTKQVRDIFTGKIKNWKEVGGKDEPISLVTTNKKHGTFDGFVDHFGLEGREDPNGTVSFKEKSAANYSSVAANAVDGNTNVLATVTTQPQTVSYASFGIAKNMLAKGATLKMLKLDGVAPSEGSIRDGSYQFQRPLLLLTKGEPAGIAKEFVDYLRAGEGQKTVATMGYLPNAVD